VGLQGLSEPSSSIGESILLFTRPYRFRSLRKIVGWCDAEVLSIVGMVGCGIGDSESRRTFADFILDSGLTTSHESRMSEGNTVFCRKDGDELFGYVAARTVANINSESYLC
jgi:hypothetical protein